MCAKLGAEPQTIVLSKDYGDEDDYVTGEVQLDEAIPMLNSGTLQECHPRYLYGMQLQPGGFRRSSHCRLHQLQYLLSKTAQLCCKKSLPREDGLSLHRFLRSP